MKACDGFGFAAGLLLLVPAMYGAAPAWRCGVAAGAANGAGELRLDVAPDKTTAVGCQSAHSFVASAEMAEGTYVVTVELGGESDAVTTVKAEARRLMLLRVATKAGEVRRERFVVSVRRPQIAGGSEVRRKPREMHSLSWDDRLTLEFSGEAPAVRSIAVEAAPVGMPTVYLAGDSTVVDQPNEPWAAWGQMLPVFFRPEIAVANHAESGETLASFEGEKRFEKVFSTIKAGDFLLMQFAHNDQKPGPGYVSPEEYSALLHKYVLMTRARGATPILVTSMNRRTFEAGKVTDTLAPYPQLTRTAAERDHVALIDLNAMSKMLYEAVGEAKSTSLFVYAAANTYPGQTQSLHDDTHFNSYGAYELARCVVLAMQQQHLGLAKFLRRDIPAFSPARPDAAEKVAVPAAPFFDLAKPYER